MEIKNARLGRFKNTMGECLSCKIYRQTLEIAATKEWLGGLFANFESEGRLFVVERQDE